MNRKFDPNREDLAKDKTTSDVDSDLTSEEDLDKGSKKTDVLKRECEVCKKEYEVCMYCWQDYQRGEACSECGMQDEYYRKEYEVCPSCWKEKNLHILTKNHQRKLENLGLELTANIYRISGIKPKDGLSWGVMERLDLTRFKVETYNNLEALRMMKSLNAYLAIQKFHNLLGDLMNGRLTLALDDYNNTIYSALIKEFNEILDDEGVDIFNELN